MDDILKRILATQAEAEKIISEAQTQSNAIIEEARQAANGIAKEYQNKATQSAAALIAQRGIESQMDQKAHMAKSKTRIDQELAAFKDELASQLQHVTDALLFQ